MTVSIPSRPSTKGMGVNERLAALNDRLSQLEYDLAGVTKRIERVEPSAEVGDARGTSTPTSTRAGARSSTSRRSSRTGSTSTELLAVERDPW